MKALNALLLIGSILVLVGCGGEGGDEAGKYQFTGQLMPYDAATTREEIVASMCGGPITRLPDDIRVGDQYDTVVSILFDGTTNVAYWYHPVVPNGQAFFYHEGHGGDPRSNGASTINGLLGAGFEVIAFQMPDVGTGHNRYNDVDHGLCVFVEPVIRMLNYLSDRGIADVYMVGLSGGGWTTSIVAAMDNRIKAAYPVAGGTPGGVGGDFEERALTQVIDLLDQWKLANHVVAIQNYNDPCCSWGNVYESIDAGPNFRGVVDYDNTQHSISQWSLNVIIDDVNSL